MLKKNTELLPLGSNQEDECTMGDLHRALDDAMEFLSVYLSYARGSEVPPKYLVDATDKAIDRVAQWRHVTRGVVILQTDAGCSDDKIMMH